MIITFDFLIKDSDSDLSFPTPEDEFEDKICRYVVEKKDVDSISGEGLPCTLTKHFIYLFGGQQFSLIEKDWFGTCLKSNIPAIITEKFTINIT